MRAVRRRCLSQSWATLRRSWPLLALLTWTGAQDSSLAQTNALSLPKFELASAREYLRGLADTIALQFPTNAESLYTRARLQGQLGEKQQAETLALQALAMQSNRTDIALFLADLFIRGDRMEEAERVLRQAISVNPAAPAAHRQLGMVLDRLGKTDEAEAAFTAAKQDNLKDPIAPLLLGRFLLDHGRIQEAVTNLELACQLDTNSANPFYPLFQAQTKLGNREAAGQALQRFKELKRIENADRGVMTDTHFDNEAELRAYTAGIHTELGNLLRQTGKKGLAEAHLLQAVAIDARRAESLEALSDFYVRDGHFEKGLEILKKAVELHPEQIRNRVNYGTLLLQTGHFPEGIEQLKRVLELEPKQPQALYNLARHYLGAKQELSKALEMSRNLADVEASAGNYDLLGWAFYANGRTNEALAALSRAVQLAPENQVMRQRLERLKKVAGVN